MKKRVLALLLVFAMVFSLVACTAGTVEEEPAVVAEPEEAEEEMVEEVAPEDVIVMKIGHSHSTEAPRHLSLLEFERLVEEKTNGGIDVEIYPNNELGTEAEMIEQVKVGVLQGVRGGMFDLVSRNFAIYLMPFLFDNEEQFQAIARSDIGDKIAAESTYVGIKVLATGDAGGFRQWTNNIRPIKTPADMKGLKMRTPGVTAIQKEMAAFGANVTAIAYAELYEALKNGQVDGQENPYQNIVDKKFYEVQKYMTVCNYQVHPDPFCVPEAWFNDLSLEYQQILIDAAKEMYVMSDQMFLDKSAENLQIIKDGGVEVYELTPEEKAVFAELGQSVIDEYVAEGLFDVDLFNLVLTELGKDPIVME